MEEIEPFILKIWPGAPVHAPYVRDISGTVV